MFPEVFASLMFPSEGSYQHGPPLLGRVRCPPVPRRLRSYCSPPTSCPPSASAPVPLAFDLPLGRMLLLCRVTRHPLPRTRRRFGHRLSVPPDLPRSGQDLPGYWAVLFVRATVDTPRQVRHPLALSSGHGTAVFRLVEPLGHLGNMRFGAASPRLTRSHAYASPDGYPLRRKASLPTCRAQLWPGGFRTRWTTHRISEVSSPPFPSDQPCLVASLCGYSSAEGLQGRESKCGIGLSSEDRAALQADS